MRRSLDRLEVMVAALPLSPCRRSALLSVVLSCASAAHQLDGARTGSVNGPTYAPTFRSFNGMHGLPLQIVYGGRSRVTTLPAVTTA